MSDPKRTITVESTKAVDRLSRRPPAYLNNIPGPLDGHGVAFPWDVPSSMVGPVLDGIDRHCEQIELLLAQVRSMTTAIREKTQAPDLEALEAVVTQSAEADSDAAAIAKSMYRGVVDPTGVAPSVIRIPNEALKGNSKTIVIPPPHEATAELPPPPPEPPVLSLPAAPTSSWKCPAHDQAAEGVSRKNRPYRYCPVCGELDRSFAP